MGPDLWWSIALGAGIGVGYGALAFMTYRYALRFRDNRFTAVALGGMLARMVLLLIVVALVMLFVRVHAAAFLIALVALLVLGLTLELVVLLRHLRASS